MGNDIKVFRELVLWLWQTHEKPWEYQHAKAKIIAEDFLQLQDTFNKYEDLERSLPTENNVCCEFGKRFLYLNPVIESRIMVPRIKLKCDFGQNIPEIRCRLELFLLDDKTNLRSLGFRLESPEGKNAQSQGVHHYYHLQMIQPPTCRLDWLPDTQPAFPLDADDPVKLILVLLISLYGLNYLSTILRDANIYKLNEYIQKLPCMRFESFKWYRLVEIGDPINKSLGYQINSNPDEFEAYIRRVYPGCNIRGITSSRFEGIRPRNRNNYP